MFKTNYYNTPILYISILRVRVCSLISSWLLRSLNPWFIRRFGEEWIGVRCYVLIRSHLIGDNCILKELTILKHDLSHTYRVFHCIYIRFFLASCVLCHPSSKRYLLSKNNSKHRGSSWQNVLYFIRKSIWNEVTA